MNEAFEKIIERLCIERPTLKLIRPDIADVKEYNAYMKAIEIVNQVADIYGGEEFHDRNKIYDYIKTQINPYGKPFQGSVKEFGYKIMDYIKNMPEEYVNMPENLTSSDVPYKNVGEIDEFCEWIETIFFTFTDCGKRFDNSKLYYDEYVFCPYCGKKVKVVE